MQEDLTRVATNESRSSVAPSEEANVLSRQQIAPSELSSMPAEREIDSESEQQDIGVIDDEEDDRRSVESELNFTDQSASDSEGSQVDEIDDMQRANVTMALEEEQDILNFADQEQQARENEANTVHAASSMSLRTFQTTLVENSRDKNSIIYLPTGTGKTRISIVSMYYYLCKYGTKKKIVFLANTIQLVKQQAEAIKQTFARILEDKQFSKDIIQKVGNNYFHLPWSVGDLNNQIICIHGERNEDQTVTKRKRIESFMTSRKVFLEQMEKATITVMISQMFLNCLRRGYLRLTDFSFMVFDECHHCDGDHPYAGIMKEFYFEQKKKNRKLELQNKFDRKDELPIIMGLTASPVFQPYNNYQTLKKELRRLCVNLDSNFATYSHGNELLSQTTIDIECIEETEQKELVPDLIEYLERHKAHVEALVKIKTHFPEYHKCIVTVLDKMAARHECLRVEVEEELITDPELYLFYDIKECLLVKIRDLWLELGEFAFWLGFNKMVRELTRLSGMRNHDNTRLLNDLIQILKKYDHQFYLSYGRCEKKLMSQKVVRLVEILTPSAEQVKDNKGVQKVQDMVLVFAFKRRTVEYLQMVLEKYRDLQGEDEKKFYRSVGVTGYASTQKSFRLPDGKSFQTNPSAEEDEASISKHYNEFLENERELQNNRIQMQSGLTEHKALTNEMNRMYFSKMGKVLLEVEEKYGNQVKKIMQFKRREQRVLITTSVTEEGFDIPGCNLVVSFDTPFSLKSYIQIKGRARKRNSRYIIFTNHNNYKKMLANRDINDNTIETVYQLAINEIAKEDLAEEVHKSSPAYEKVATKGGALLNTSYALELLKSYFTSLKPPNRPYFHFIETTNICFKCAIKFPESSTCSRNYIVGKPHPTKLDAMRSSAFEAVKTLKKEGFITDHLRSSRLEELENEMENEKYDDLGHYHKDASYRAIFDQMVKIEEIHGEKISKKLLRFFFRTLPNERLEFPFINENFGNQWKREGEERRSFQIYQVKFENKAKFNLLSEMEGVNEIGLLTCFEPQDTNEMFAGLKQGFEPLSGETFELKLVQREVLLTGEEYEQLKEVHKFLLNAEKNNEVDYYNWLCGSPAVVSPNWLTHDKKKVAIRIDETRRYYPVLVLMRRGEKEWGIDQKATQNVFKHQELMKRVYLYHNKPARFIYDKMFEENLKSELEKLQDSVARSSKYSLSERKHKRYLVQSIHKDMCFHKGYLLGGADKESPVTIYNKEIEAAEENKKKNKLKNKFEKMRKMYQHCRENNDIYKEELVKIELWKIGAKEDFGEFLNKDLKIKKLNEEKGIFHFLKEFVLFPVSYPTMLRVALASKYVFPTLEDHCIALYFRKYYLTDIMGPLKTKIASFTHYAYKYYPNVILDNAEPLFSSLTNGGKSKYLRDLGKSCLINLSQGNILNRSLNDGKSFSLDMSSIHQPEQNVSLNQSANQSSSNIFGRSDIIERTFSIDDKAPTTKVNLDLLQQLKIDDILRALTSKIYKHHKNDNYEEFEFIGDVVLKLLATIQIFLERTDCEEGEMHIARANLICNANLHRAAIKNKLFQYIFTTRTRTEPVPLVKYEKEEHKIKNEEPGRYHNTKIPLLGPHEDDEGFQYIPGKVHADVMEALIGIFYLNNKSLNDCQTLLYAFGILNKPTLYLEFTHHSNNCPLPEEYMKLENRIQYRFRNKGLLMQAMTHPSFLTYIEDVIEKEESFSELINASRHNDSKTLSLLAEKTIDKQYKLKKQEIFYERLEFLGDAVLDLLVVEYLYDKGGDHITDEGTLSFLKQSAVSNKSLGFIALQLNLHDLIMMDLDDMDSTIREFRAIKREVSRLPSPLEFSKLKIGSLKVLGDVFESLIGAIYIDTEFSYDATKEVVYRMAYDYIRHFTDLRFIEQCPSYKYKEYLDQNNYKKLKLQKVIEEGISNGEYMYKFVDNKGNEAGSLRASNEKDAWDRFFEQKADV